jgi:aspartyl-tRNA(Asn)/glutamyl-tRNA(Gln) amidotransferase subunit A
LNNNAKSISDFVNGIESERIDVNDAIQDELENVRDYNKSLNAFITIFDKRTSFAISKVTLDSRSEQLLRKFPLLGIPLTVKDNIFIAGHRTTAGSAVFQDFIPSVNADIVDSAVAIGCIPIGKTNMHELAMGATSSSSFFGPVRNPKDSKRISGGSSGGSAVSVAMSKLPIISLGTDTGGSVRIPAALCGICGFKPTFGLISTVGLFPLSATLDHVGIMTRSMPDMRVAFAALTGYEQANEPSRRARPSRVLKVGIPGGYFFKDCSPSVDRAFWRAIEKMQKTGFQIIEGLEIQGIEKMSRTRRTIQVAEAFWFYEDLVKDPEKRKLVAKDVLSFFDRGSKTGMMELLASRQVRLDLIQNISRVLQLVDFIAMPTCLATAPKLDEVLGKEAGDIRNQLVRNTEPFNVSGFPSLTIPINDDNSSELPTGIEISGPAFEDAHLLDAGERIWKCFQHS